MQNPDPNPIETRIIITFDAEDGTIRIGVTPGVGINNVIPIAQTLIITHPRRNIVVVSLPEPST